MIFALLFIIAFLIGLAGYLLTGKWLTAALISMGLFVLNVISDTSGNGQVGITLILGLPVVFVASLLGAYVVELRRGVAEEVNDASHEGFDDSESQNITETIESSADEISATEKHNKE